MADNQCHELNVLWREDRGRFSFLFASSSNDGQTHFSIVIDNWNHLHRTIETRPDNAERINGQLYVEFDEWYCGKRALPNFEKLATANWRLVS